MPRVGKPSRPAFVLVELLIVLAVLVGVAAISWPAVRGMMAKSEIQSAAKQVLAALARARLDAMESESVRQFRYQPGAGRFEIAGLDSSADASAEGGTAGAGDRISARPVEDVLPSGVRFDSPDGETAEAADPRLSTPALETEDWSAPLWFFPNGRTSNAIIRLRGRQNHVVQLSLRGVTGTVTIGKPEQAEVEP